MPEDFYFNRLVKIMKQLRSESGCPWDREQNHQSLKPYLLEECYEALEAIDLEDDEEIKKELGDVLLQVVFHAQIAEERNRFNIDDVIHSIIDKLIRRHPHVFENAPVKDSQQALENWEKIKREEATEEGHVYDSHLDGIPKNLPALVRAQKIQKRVAKNGFDWPEVTGALKKVQEECNELIEAEQIKSKEDISSEYGDVLFSIVNIARFLDIDAEQMLRGATNKFERRFRAVELRAQTQHKNIDMMSLEELNVLWDQVKAEE